MMDKPAVNAPLNVPSPEMADVPETADEATPVDAVEFRAAMAGFASGVTVVSVQDELDDIAMTATSFTSVSLEPPLVLVCIEKGTHMHEVMARNELFGVTMLSAAQRSLAS